ncbi:MAG: hypothetical protein U0694_20910 [Anaerolineae bacterium]
MIALPEGDGWGPVLEGSYVKSLSQEHGVIQADDETFERTALGSLGDGAACAFLHDRRPDQKLHHTRHRQINQMMV